MLEIYKQGLGVSRRKKAYLAEMGYEWIISKVKLVFLISN